MAIAQRRTAGSRQAPRPFVLRLSRLLKRFFRRLRRLVDAVRNRQRGLKGVELAPRWPRRRGSFVLQAGVSLGALLLVGWGGRAV